MNWNNDPESVGADIAWPLWVLVGILGLIAWALAAWLLYETVKGAMS